MNLDRFTKPFMWFLHTEATGAPNSGTNAGGTTVQGFVDSAAIPEPATLGLVGGALLGLGILKRKKLAVR
jgi:hypothetical protein